MLQFFNVSKVYPNGVQALVNISFSVKKGEFVFLVGPSGAGKTTITKLIIREEVPTRGQLFFNGWNVGRLKPSEVPYLRRNVGMIFQDFKLLPNKTVYENVAFALEVTGASKKEIKKSVPQVLQMVGLENKANMWPGQLSAGEQQRVAIARALVKNPPMLIADEPTGNLDPDTAWEIMKLLEEINKLGTTIIMATHAKDIVDSMKKRVIALEKGRIVRDEERGQYGYES
ncbi:MAG: cell division transport system ATP-binding protein [Eubacteriales bacterium]|nr:cell division transport system ATP-binding protein [Eubacteriales bacterium]MDN5363187.1 cell division transport system ATP-binding protein [Eubacteriales bacterium]